MLNSFFPFIINSILFLLGIFCASLIL